VLKFLNRLRWRIALLRSRRSHGGLLRLHGTTVDLPANIELQFAKKILRGTYEKTEADFIRRYLPADRPAIELGGSLGVISAVIRTRLDPDQPFVVVEANPMLLGICKANLLRHDKRGNSRLEHAAVYYGAERVWFAASTNAHVSRIASEHSAGDAIVEVPAVTLTALIDGLASREPISLVCDIEGAEYSIFRNDLKALRRVGIAIVEIHPLAFAEQGNSESGFLGNAARAGLKVVSRHENVLVLAR
jgi:FkbM family methyltransferase